MQIERSERHREIKRDRERHIEREKARETEWADI